MAELPEVEVLLGKLRGAENRRLEESSFKGGRGATQEEQINAILARIQGKRLTDLARYGAVLLLEFGDEGILSLSLAGDVELQLHKGKAEIPENNRLLLRFQGALQLCLSGSALAARIRLLDENAEVDYLAKMGPDALLVRDLATPLAAALAKRRGKIRTLLMQDLFTPGIGPVWADEILFQSRIRPDRPAPDLNEEERTRLLKTIAQVLERAVRCQAKAPLLPKTYLTRHRGDLRCPGCGGTLESLPAVGKDCLFCPRCQP